MNTRSVMPASALFLGLAFLISCLAVSAAHAQQCTPTVIGSPAANADAMTVSVSWGEVTGCAGPGTVELLQGGKPFGTEGPLTSFENGGKVTSSPLASGVPYSVQLCAIYGLAPAATRTFCTTPFSIAWTPPVSTPTPTITSYSSTEDTVTFSWIGAPQYSFYNVRLNGGDQQKTSGPPFTFQGPLVNPGNRQNTVAVQGCVGQGYNHSLCSLVASQVITTLPAPAVAGPQGLHTTVDDFLVPPSGSQYVINVLWTEPVAEQALTLVSLTRSGGNSAAPLNVTYSGVNFNVIDKAVSPGQSYIYTVCLTDKTNNNAPVCDSTSVYLPAGCQFATSCPFYQNQPPQYSLSCGAPRDFYTSSGTPANVSTPDPTTLVAISKRANSVSGVAVGEAVSVWACLPGTTDHCSSQSIEVDRGHWCLAGVGRTPPTDPPLRNCSACEDSNQRCVRVAGGFQCKGTAF